MKPKTLSEPIATRVADLFATLSDASRVRIISALLEGESDVGTLAQDLLMTESAVSHQLRGLRQMHVVRARRLGRHMIYRLEDEQVGELLQMGLDQLGHG